MLCGDAVQHRSVFSSILAKQQLFERSENHRHGRRVHGRSAAEGPKIVRFHGTLLLRLQQRTHVKERYLLSALRFLRRISKTHLLSC